MGSIRSAPILAVDFPVDNADLQATIDKVDLLVQNGYLSGAGLSQVLAEIGTFFALHGETSPPPTAIFTGTAGNIARYYAAVIEYPLAIDNPPRPFPYRNVGAMPGAPVQGRTTQNLDRTKRYSATSTPIEVTNTSAPLSAADYISLTAPTYTGPVAGATFAIVATNEAGEALYGVAEGVAPGATVVDAGTFSTIAAGSLPTYPEFAIVPAAAATATVVVSGTPSVGGKLSVDVGGVTATYAPTANDTDATAAAALAGEIGTLQPLVSAVANGPVITLTALADGPAGNLPISSISTSATMQIGGSFGLAGGTASYPVYSPRTRVTGPAGV